MKRWMKYCMAFLVASITVLPLTVAGAQEDVTLHITREGAMDLLLEDNTSLKGLEAAEIDLVNSFVGIRETGSMLEGIYEQLPRYQELHEKLQVTMGNSDYAAYFAYQQISQDALTAEEIAAIEALEAGFVASDYEAMLTMVEYVEYQKLLGMFGNLGISSPNMSSSQIYDTFIYTMEIAPLSLQAAIESVQLNALTVEKSLSIGVDALYNSVLSMEGTTELLYNNYKSALSAAAASDAKLALDLVTEAENRQAHINEEKAELDYEKMLRQMDNMTLSLKDMIGLDPSIRLILDDEVIDQEPLKELSYYTEKALEERSEVITAKSQVTFKLMELDLMADWFYESDTRFDEVEEALRRLQVEEAQAQKDVEADVIKAFNNVLAKANDLEDAKNALSIAEKEYQEMVLRSTMGYVLATDLIGIGQGVTSAENALTTASGAYTTALMVLENASSVGPSYQ